MNAVSGTENVTACEGTVTVLWRYGTRELKIDNWRFLSPLEDDVWYGYFSAATFSLILFLLQAGRFLHIAAGRKPAYLMTACRLFDPICNAEMTFLRKKTFFCKKGDRFTPFLTYIWRGMIIDNSYLLRRTIYGHGYFMVGRMVHEGAEKMAFGRKNEVFIW